MKTRTADEIDAARSRLCQRIIEAELLPNNLVQLAILRGMLNALVWAAGETGDKVSTMERILGSDPLEARR